MAGQVYTLPCRQKGAAERVVAGRARTFQKEKSKLRLVTTIRKTGRQTGGSSKAL